MAGRSTHFSCCCQHEYRYCVCRNEPLRDRWSLKSIRDAQQNDEDNSCIVDMIRNCSAKPPWESAATQSRDVKLLWNMWPRLQIRNGPLRRRFESPDGTSTVWQVVLPSTLREEFLIVVHGGMTGGHLARSRTAASIQGRAYWPLWSSYLDAFLKRCVSCARIIEVVFPVKHLFKHRSLVMCGKESRQTSPDHIPVLLFRIVSS